MEKQEEIILKQGEEMQKQNKKIARLEEIVNSNNGSSSQAWPSSQELKIDCSDLVKALETKVTEQIDSTHNHLNNGKLFIQK